MSLPEMPHSAYADFVQSNFHTLDLPPDERLAALQEMWHVLRNKNTAPSSQNVLFQKLRGETVDRKSSILPLEGQSPVVCCIDTETDGLCNPLPIQIAICVGQLTQEKLFQEIDAVEWTIRPSIPTQKLETILEHHVSNLSFQVVNSGISEKEALDQMLKFLDKYPHAVIVCHNVDFDIQRVLQPALARHGLTCKLLDQCYTPRGRNYMKTFDTMEEGGRIARSKFRGPRLSTLCVALGVEQITPTHNALPDARTLLLLLNAGLKNGTYALLHPFEEDKLSSMAYRELQILCKKRKLFATGSKEELIGKLKKSKTDTVI